ncbi:NADP-dependent oxidoreductase [Curtobacterium sp. USHLN213]|uniref:NADP-dependent oxidoreductase n=1 Tax=Curtobacterium sp. USHLN213 TaxID=3081255 RepID=UPI003018C3B5
MSKRIVQNEFGGPETLHLEDVRTPKAADLADDEVLLRVSYASVNTIDVMTRAGGGMAAAGIISTPYTPGWDVSGTVEAIGTAVDDLARGDRVLGLVGFPHHGGTYAEHVVAKAEHLVRTPAALSDAAAAALPMAAMTAWQAFTDTTTLTTDDRVLITGAGGGVGHLAVQIARHLGATVIAVADAGKHDWLRDLGADLTVDYHDQDAMAALAERPVDVAFNLAAPSLARALGAVRRDGILIALGGGAADAASSAETAGVRFAATHVHIDRGWLEAVTALAGDGVILPVVSESFAVRDAAQAHRAISGGHTRGKIVLRP